VIAPLFVLLVGTTETNTGFWWDFAILIANLLVAVTGLLIVVLAILFAMIRSPSDDAQVAAPDGIPDIPLDRLAQPSGHQVPDGQRVIVTPILGGLHHEYHLQPIAA